MRRSSFSRRPRACGPRATFSRTVRHGRSVESWKAIARSGAGLVTGGVLPVLGGRAALGPVQRVRGTGVVTRSGTLGGRLAGLAVARAAELHLPLHRLSLDEMKKVEPKITKAVFDVLSVERSVTSRTSFGGTAPKNVRTQAKKWLKTLERERE